MRTTYDKPFIVVGETGINKFYAIGTIKISKSFDGYFIYHNFNDGNSANSDRQLYLAVFSKDNLLIDFIVMGQLIEGLEKYNSNTIIHPNNTIVKISNIDNKLLYEKYFFKELNTEELEYYTIELSTKELKGLGL
ncbi:hypothetical protein [Algibacter sp. 2305UL17-15]|uniref:hypothetical protein n=1 Tax=Algibacter sp. 2305UL17-15 TaxID=3231268 RepID=UPI00345A5D07